MLLAAATSGWSSTVLYQFNGTADSPATSVPSGVTAGDLTQNHLTFQQGGETIFFTATDWPVGAFVTSYFEWSIAPGIDTLWIDYSAATFGYTIGTNPTFTTELRTSLDGFTSSIATEVSNAGISDYPADSLAELGRQTGTVTFRLYGYTNGNFGSSGFYNSSINIDGITVMTPEPSTGGLLAGAGLLLACLLRRSRKQAC
jgi:hypothetical protein